MGCVKTSGKPATLNLTWAADAKEYKPAELALLINYIDQTTAWLGTIGWADGDVFAYRVGSPTVRSTSNSELEELYTAEVSGTSSIINGLSVDMIKITSKGLAVAGVSRVARSEGYNDTYTYKSQYKHDILSNYFVDGVNNATRYATPAKEVPGHWDYTGSEAEWILEYTIPEVVHVEKYMYIDEEINGKKTYNCKLGASAGLNAEYAGVRQLSANTTLLEDSVIPAVYEKGADGKVVYRETATQVVVTRSIEMDIKGNPKIVHRYANGIEVLTPCSTTVVTPAGTKPGAAPFVVKCFNMIAQNFRLLGEFSEVEAGKKGDVVYLSIPKLLYKLSLVKENAVKESGEFFGEYYEDLQYILEYAGMHQAFKDVQYGGQIEKLDLVMRIPTSWENEKTLKGLIEDKEVATHYGVELTAVTDALRDGYFSYVLDARMVSEDAFSDTAVTEHVQKEHLLDVDNVNAALNRIKLIPDDKYDSMTNDDLWTVNQWFTADNGYTKSQIVQIKGLSAGYSETKGCKWEYTTSTTDDDNNVIYYTHTEYRHWYIRASWIDSLDYNRAAIVFWMGLDLSTSADKRCGLDQIIVIIIVLIITRGNIKAAEAAGAWYVAAAAAAGVISIGLTLGAFGTGKTARNMAILAAVLSLGSSYGSVAAATSSAALQQATIGFVLQVASTGLIVYQTMEAYKFNKDMTEMAAELAVLNAASTYESDLRLMYEDSYRMPYTQAYKDPYQEIRDIYKPFSSYPNSIGFQET